MKKIMLLGFLLGLICCEKKETDPETSIREYEKITPFSYFPVYPGSFWSYKEYKKVYLYDDNSTTFHLDRIDSLTTIDTVSSDYRPHNYLIKPDYVDGDFVERYSDTVLVPFLNGQPIYGYSRIDKSSQLSAPTYYDKYPFLTETKGDTLVPRYYDPRHEFLGPYLVIFDKMTDNQNDSVIIVKGYYYGNYNDNIIEWITYKKDIGLISHYVYSPIFQDTIYEKILIDYEIRKE